MEIKAPSGPFKKCLTLSHVKTHGPKCNITRGSGEKTTVTTFATVHAVVDKRPYTIREGGGSTYGVEKLTKDLRW